MSNVIIDYTNWRGIRSKRYITPVSIKFESTKWHPEEQWILHAIDLESGNFEEKGFAMNSIHSWK